MNRRGKTKEGFLNVKQPSRFGKAWKRKWVVIRPNATKGSDKTSVLLELYLEKGAYNKTVTSLLLEDVTVIKRVISKSQPKAFEFVKGSNVVLTLAGDSEMDTQEWIDVFRKFLLPPAEQKELTALPGCGTYVTRVSVIPNKDSERLKLTGNYLATVSRLAVTLHNIITGDKVLEWDLRHLKRFMLPSKGPQHDLEKIACLQISNRSPQGEGEYLLYSQGAKPLVESIYQRLSSAITVKERRSRTSSMLFEIPPQELEQFAKAIQEGGDPGFVLVGADGSVEEDATDDACKEKGTVKTNGDAGTNHVDKTVVKESSTEGTEVISDANDVHGSHSPVENKTEITEQKDSDVVVEDDMNGTSSHKDIEESTDKQEIADSVVVGNVSNDQLTEVQVVSPDVVSNETQDVATEPIDKDENETRVLDTCKDGNEDKVPETSKNRDSVTEDAVNAPAEGGNVLNDKPDERPADPSSAGQANEDTNVIAQGNYKPVVTVSEEDTVRADSTSNDEQNDSVSDAKKDTSPADKPVTGNSNDNLEVINTDTDIIQKDMDNLSNTEVTRKEGETMEEIDQSHEAPSNNVEPNAENDNEHYREHVISKEATSEDNKVNVKEGADESITETSMGEAQQGENELVVQESMRNLPSTDDSTKGNVVEETEEQRLEQESEKHTTEVEATTPENDTQESKESDDRAEESTPVETEEHKEDVEGIQTSSDATAEGEDNVQDTPTPKEDPDQSNTSIDTKQSVSNDEAPQEMPKAKGQPGDQEEKSQSANADGQTEVEIKGDTVESTAEDTAL